MKCKLPLLSVALLLTSNSWASDQPYYQIEEFNVTTDGANYGAYPSALSEESEDGQIIIGTYSNIFGS